LIQDLETGKEQCICEKNTKENNAICFQVYNEALYHMLKKNLVETNLATAEMAFAWRAFNFDVTTRNILGVHHGSSSRPGKMKLP
jgi:hypothetical protein